MMVDQVLLNDTLQKINMSLNQRFERDADLYISKQDEYELKRHICKGEFGAVRDMIRGKKIRPEIVVKVLIRNAGVIMVRDIRVFDKEMRPILEGVSYQMIKDRMEEVLNHTMYVEKELRHLLFWYYIKGIALEQRIEYWESDRYYFDAFERKSLFYLIWKDKKEEETLQSKLEFGKSAFIKYPILLKEEEVFLELKEILLEKDKGELFCHLRREMNSFFIKDELYYRMIGSAYVSYGEEAFEDAISKIREKSHKNFKYYIKAIAKILEEEKEKDRVLHMFDMIEEVFQSLEIKPHIKKRINDKIWVAAKRNAVLYKERKVQIDLLLADIEQKEKKQYITYEEIWNDIKNGEKNERIAFSWANMKGKILEQSLMDSFQNTPDMYRNDIKEIYLFLFEHSQKRGGDDTLSKFCNIMASAILNGKDRTEMVEIADRLLLDYVLRYNVKGDKIVEYLANYHFKEYQNRYIN